MLPLHDIFNDAQVRAEGVVPLIQVSNDLLTPAYPSQRNLIVSVVMAATLDVPEVCIFMDDQVCALLSCVALRGFSLGVCTAHAWQSDS
jgi:hypothetical protein